MVLPTEPSDILKERNESSEYEKVHPNSAQTPRTMPGAWPETFKEKCDPTEESHGSDHRADLESVYGPVDFPFYGPQYDSTNPVAVGAQSFSIRNYSDPHVETLNFYENMIISADADLEKSYMESLEALKDQETGVSEVPITIGFV